MDGMPARSPGQSVRSGQRLCAVGERFVSRGGHKLVHALDHFTLDPAGANAMDVGASTGGFTDVLLRRGAARVAAVDVGHGQLAPELVADERVRVCDGVNARALTADDIPFAPDFVVVDLSFISLPLVLPAVLSVTARPCRLVALIKPQFEVGREHVGKGGLVRDESAIAQSAARVAATVARQDFTVIGTVESPIAGGDGNRELLLAAEALH